MRNFSGRVSRGFYPPNNQKPPKRIARVSNPHAVTYSVNVGEKFVFEHPIIPQGFKMACQPSNEAFTATIKINDTPIRIINPTTFFTIQFIGCLLLVTSSSDTRYIGVDNFENGFIHSIEIVSNNLSVERQFYVEGFEGG